MSLEEMIKRYDRVKFSPRTLNIDIRPDIAEGLSPEARAFLRLAHDKHDLTILDIVDDKWRSNSSAVDFFENSEAEVRTEILSFIVLFIHEYTHRIDLLITPFGLHYYLRILDEYRWSQQFFPRALDNAEALLAVAEALGQLRFSTESDTARCPTAVAASWRERRRILLCRARGRRHPPSVAMTLTSATSAFGSRFCTTTLTKRARVVRSTVLRLS